MIYKSNDESTELPTHQTSGLDIIATAAHEIRSPLAIIMGFSQVLASRNIHEEEKIELAKSIFENSIMIRDIVNEYMDIAKITSGAQGQLNLSPIDPKVFLNRFINSLTRKKNKDIKLGNHSITAIPPEKDLPKVFIDESKIKCVLQNLLSNSTKYSASDKPITISMDSVFLDGRSLVRIDVIDNGCGIQPEELSEVFKPYWRSKHNSLNTQGNGIGLSIAKNIMEAHGGMIRIESKVSIETKVSIFLPATI
jgi:two-component system sensor histidine kinase ResE